MPLSSHEKSHLTKVRGKLFRASTDRNKTELEKSYPEFNSVTKLD